MVVMSSGEIQRGKDNLGAGDSYLVTDILSPELADVAFRKLKDEVKWETMYHRGGEVPRLVAVEGEVSEDGCIPFYRHPADYSPPLRSWSPTVALIRDAVQKVIKQPVNHVLIQHYRSGNDYISEHSDKTIDVVRGSNIVNFSLGAQRMMILRTKKDKAMPVPPSDSSAQIAKSPATFPETHMHRTTQRIPLPHNSMFVMGPATNAKWLHGINRDNRPFKLKSVEEQAEGGERISLTFRHIGTFLTKDESKIWGQGAQGKTLADAHPVVNGTNQGEELIIAFGRENHESDFDWDAHYGAGFNVLHFSGSFLDAVDTGPPS